MHLRCKHTICTIKAGAGFVNSFTQISRFFGKDRKESRFFVEDAGNPPIFSQNLIFSLSGTFFLAAWERPKASAFPKRKSGDNPAFFCCLSRCNKQRFISTAPARGLTGWPKNSLRPFFIASQ